MGYVVRLSPIERESLSELQQELSDLGEKRSQLLQSIASTRRVTVDQLFASIGALDQAALRARATNGNLPSGPFKELFDSQLEQIVTILADVRACAMKLDRELQTMSGGQTDRSSSKKPPLGGSSMSHRG
jgi:hypothetical protein